MWIDAISTQSLFQLTTTQTTCEEVDIDREFVQLWVGAQVRPRQVLPVHTRNVAAEPLLTTLYP